MNIFSSELEALSAAYVLVKSAHEILRDVDAGMNQSEINKAYFRSIDAENALNNVLVAAGVDVAQLDTEGE